MDMLEILESKGTKDIIDANDYVYLLKSMFTIEIIKLKEIEEYQFGTTNTNNDGYTYREKGKP